MSRRTHAVRLLLGSLALLAAACNTVESPTTPTTGPFTETFSSQLGARGSATRSFTVKDTGTVSVTLTSVGPPATVEVGLGVGIPNSSGSGCNLTRSVVTGSASNPQLAIPADGGVYCVRVFDVGNLSGEVTFSVSVLHP